MQNDIIISKADRGVKVVVMDRTLYIETVNSHAISGHYVEIKKDDIAIDQILIDLR